MLVLGHGYSQKLGFGDHLVKEVVVWRDINRRPDAFVQATLQAKQPDDGLPGPGVHLESVVGTCPLAVPGIEDVALLVRRPLELRGVALKRGEDLTGIRRLC